MRVLVFVITVFASILAHADGFICKTIEGDLVIKVFNHVHPQNGTRRAAVMVVLDPNVRFGRRTIARFEDHAGQLSSSGTTYRGTLPGGEFDRHRGAALVDGTQWGGIKQVVVEVDHNYERPLKKGDVVSGVITFVREDGGEVSQDLLCLRYLKGSR